MTLPQETRFQAALLVEAGVIVAEAARMLSVSSTYVKAACDEFGVDTTQANLGRQTKYDLEITKLCKKLKRQGKYAREIVEIVNSTTEWTINEKNVAYLTKDVKRPSRNPKKISGEAKQMCLTLKESGFFAHHIADQVNQQLGHNFTIKQVVEATKSVSRPMWKDGNTGLPHPASPRDMAVFNYYCQDFKTLRETAVHFNITHERVRQILAKLKKRHGLERKPKPVPKNECGYCGNEFTQEPGRKRKYCSHECGIKAGSLNRRRPGCVSDREATTTLTCAHCGCSFERTNYEMNIRRANYKQAGRVDSGKYYCNRECYENRAKPYVPKPEVQEVFHFQQDTGVFPVPAA